MAGTGGIELGTKGRGGNRATRQRGNEARRDEGDEAAGRDGGDERPEFRGQHTQFGTSFFVKVKLPRTRASAEEGCGAPAVGPLPPGRGSDWAVSAAADRTLHEKRVQAPRGGAAASQSPFFAQKTSGIRRGGPGRSSGTRHGGQAPPGWYIPRPASRRPLLGAPACAIEPAHRGQIVIALAARGADLGLYAADCPATGEADRNPATRQRPRTAHDADRQVGGTTRRAWRVWRRRRRRTFHVPLHGQSRPSCR